MNGPAVTRGSGAQTPPAVHLIGVGPGPVDLLTVRASRLIAMSGTCLHAHGAVPAEAMSLVPPTARVVDISGLSEGQAIDEISAALGRGDRVVHLFAGDPGQHPESRTLADTLDSAGISWEHVPGICHPDFTSPVDVEGPHPGGGTGADGGPATGQAAGVNDQSGAGAPASTTPGKILVLGGTVEARRLADLLVSAGLDVVTALAGKLARPRLPRGEVLIGGFGDVDGLAQWLRATGASAVIDATDPFAVQISTDAILAAADTGVPLLRLQRPRWTEGEGDRWIRVPDMRAAVEAVRGQYRRPMLTVGKLGASEFAGDSQGAYLIRCSEPPPGPLPERYLLVLDKGPFGVDSERTIMSRHRIDVLVTRESGGRASAAKLEAARALNIPVVMVDRPRDPAEAAGLPTPETVHRVDEAARWLVERFGSR
ncbi:hypothetical protein NCCP2495_00220 [Dietzia sp. NCCP-2495]|uniref:cobalt-precorrin-6A reductase n=1 Tax=Dietzia sp. NCCP-2495 TaxID=2934675 RepID=UPI00222FC222|nr:cobalt-precorrin-6A reductase [Dietzia sp. NCCP-2495]GLB62144.1 hypothetical protein NCCP2495_00220 [Dietzia sp. NCCP-2495]